MKTLLTIFLILATTKVSAPNFSYENSKIENYFWSYTDSYNYLKLIGCKYPIESTAQTIAEAGWNYTSQIAKGANNITGMKLAKVRKTTATGKYKNHAAYLSKKDCLIDLVLWQNFTGAKGDYLEHLQKCNYFKDTKYKQKLKQIIYEIKSRAKSH